MDRDHLIDIRDRVLARMVADGFAGADPFDGLESSVFRASGLGRFRLARLAWLQTIKRGPEGLRKAVRIPPTVNPKTLALLSGAGKGMVLFDVRDRLIDLQNPDGGWGYPFEWQARAFHAKRHQSNAIVTSFVVDALLQSGMQKDHPALVHASGFVAQKLWRDGYFAYFDHVAAEIHNASLWAAFALYRIIGPNDKAAQAVERVINAQQADGSWSYGTRSHHQFVDGFHTGYVLDLLHRLRASGMHGLDNAIARGWQFYRTECFDQDGVPRSFAGRDGYLDAHAVAQAMASLCRFGDRDGATRLAVWVAENLFDPSRDLFFAGIKKDGRPDRRNYTRWTQAWMVWALSIVIENTDPNPSSPQDQTMSNFDPTKPLSFAHPDPNRVEKEAALRALAEPEFRVLYNITRAAASRAKADGAMETLYGLTRGMKTLQRIGAEQGIILGIRRGG
ncbi:MAG: terpene cyclase/mutase family protein [Thalassospira sp.]|uniref:prenyltransferase/squalene oxidase repeat-containing protein n=1 Tax=Thalassospira sp. TaxID=1912094 RepID=UPI001B035D78|nr:terpene cyclase/mutase family protein [Thalassospira sp.]MBO6580993.1 terpene cyclase/mutase family protein [Thalassospira sp.]MBO6803553.1 terpene cyclase/mutase family protein [Thalassospira sp.]MBO6819805.1 terpene cyclase/mutase family protein [Thalassospira sp.]MBO6886498.1 terpene cyclase/mutase family protein [Thalassospira sp.]